MNVGYLQRRASREQCAAYVWGPLTPARDDARNARSDNQTANNINKTSTSPLQCPQTSVKQSLDALHFIVNISTEFVIHLSLSLPNLYYTLRLIKTATASCSNNNKKKQAHWDSSRRLLLGQADVPLAGDCLGSAGCVASAMMMYAHLPWLLASSSRG